MQEVFLNYYFLKYFEFWISKTWGRVAVVCFLIWKWIQSANLIWFLIICLSLKNIFRGIRNSQAACGILWQLIVFKRISSVSSLDLVHKVCLFIPALSFPLIFFFCLFQLFKLHLSRISISYQLNPFRMLIFGSYFRNYFPLAVFLLCSSLTTQVQHQDTA